LEQYLALHAEAVALGLAAKQEDGTFVSMSEVTYVESREEARPEDEKSMRTKVDQALDLVSGKYW
jgi:hypothetical protein